MLILFWDSRIYIWASYEVGYIGPTSIRINLKVKGKDKVVPVFNETPHHEGVLGSGGIAPLILWPQH
jgi:hypothetical protein